MFSLIWDRATQSEFARFWLRADTIQRQAIARSIQRIILELSANPQSAGESRDRGRRILLEAPVGVLFKVDAKRMRVRILQIWEY